MQICCKNCCRRSSTTSCISCCSRGNSNTPSSSSEDSSTFFFPPFTTAQSERNKPISLFFHPIFHSRSQSQKIKPISLSFHPIFHWCSNLVKNNQNHTYNDWIINNVFFPQLQLQHKIIKKQSHAYINQLTLFHPTIQFFPHSQKQTRPSLHYLMNNFF